MNSNLCVGSIVMLMNSEYNIYQAMIIQKDVYEVGEKFQYLAISYPTCFVGLDSFTLVNDNNIFELIYDAANQSEQNAIELCPSSIVEYQDKNYLVIGKNVRYAGSEQANEYAVVETETTQMYDIKYLKEEQIERVVTFGYSDVEQEQKVSLKRNYKQMLMGILPFARRRRAQLSLENKRLIKNERNKKINHAIRSFKAFLPLGSVVTLATDQKQIKVMIIARNVETSNNHIADYSGVRLETGYIGNEYVVMFDKSQVMHVEYLGYFDVQEVEYNYRLLIKRGIIDG